MFDVPVDKVLEEFKVIKKYCEILQYWFRQWKFYIIAKIRYDV